MTQGNPRLARTFIVAAVLTGLAAAWLVIEYTGSVERRYGRPLQTLIASQAIARGAVISNEMLAARDVPEEFVPADAVKSIEARGVARAAADISAGAYLTESLLVTGSAASAGYKLRRSERALSVDAKISPDGATVHAGAIVDLFASGFGGLTQTQLVLAGAEVLAAEDSSAAQEQQRLTLRVASSQAAVVIRSDVFARELRAIVRP